MRDDAERGLPPRAFWVIALLCAALLRLGLGDEIEYWRDERVMFELSRDRGLWESLTSPGMPSGAEVPNPGLSVFVFVLLRRAFLVQTPAELARAATVLNLAALCVLAAYARTRREGLQRSTWLWALALLCVNPMAVMLHRKIWAQSVLPFFCILMVLGWTHRGRRWGALLWGFLQACLGQIHMSGFFFAAAVLLWTWAGPARSDAQRAAPPRTQRLPWLAGFALGALPLIAWLPHLLEHVRAHGLPLRPCPGAALQVAWFLADWVTDGLGLGLYYSVGTDDFLRLLRHPLVGGRPTFGVVLLHAIAAAAGLRIFIPAARRALAELRGARRRQAFASLLLGGPEDMLEKAALWGFAGMLGFLGIVVYRHYLLVTFPFEWVWLARLALDHDRRLGARCLSVLWACQLLLSVCVLHYVHVSWFSVG